MVGETWVCRFYIKLSFLSISTIRKKSEKEELQELEETKSNTDVVLAGTIICPAWGNEFTLEADFDIKEAKEFLPELIEGINKSKTILSQKDSFIELKNKDISRLRMKLNEVEKKEERRSKLNRSYKREESSSVQEDRGIE